MKRRFTQIFEDLYERLIVLEREKHDLEHERYELQSTLRSLDRRIASLDRGVNDDDSGDREHERDPTFATYRDCERSRIRTILKSPEAERNMKAAMRVAFNTTMPRDQAVAFLSALRPAKAGEKEPPE